MEKNTPLSPPLALEMSGGRLSGLLVTAFEGRQVRVLCLDNQAEFLLPLEQAPLLSPLTREWMEDYLPCGVPYPIQLREDGGFFFLGRGGGKNGHSPLFWKVFSPFPPFLLGICARLAVQFPHLML